MKCCKVSDILTILNSFSSSASAKIKNVSALNPLLWIIGMVTISCFCLASYVSIFWLQIFFLIIGTCPIFFTFFCYSYFMFNKAEYLRSEEFHFKKFATEMFGAKGKKILPESDYKTLIENPDKSKKKLK